MPWKAIVEQWTQTITSKYPDAAKTLKATLDQYGGVSGFAKQLKDPATQEKLKTWAKDGKQFVMSQEQVQKFLGNEKLKAISEKLSTTEEKILAQLMEVLPPLIEKVQKIKESLPEIPEDSIVGKAMSSIQGWLGMNSTHKEPRSKADQIKKEPAKTDQIKPENQ